MLRKHTAIHLTSFYQSPLCKWAGRSNGWRFAQICKSTFNRLITRRGGLETEGSGAIDVLSMGAGHKLPAKLRPLEKRPASIKTASLHRFLMRLKQPPQTSNEIKTILIKLADDTKGLGALSGQMSPVRTTPKQTLLEIEKCAVGLHVWLSFLTAFFRTLRSFTFFPTPLQQIGLYRAYIGLYRREL